MNAEKIFETPTKKGWIVIWKLAVINPTNGFIEQFIYNVNFRNEARITFSSEDLARAYAQGLYEGIECAGVN